MKGLKDRMYKTPRELWALNPQEGDFGLEIEVEGFNIKHAVQGWRGKEDHSLRGESLEYVTSEAVKYEDLPKTVGRLCKRLNMDGVAVAPSSRTSTHIHVNFQKEPLFEIAKYWVLFALIEPCLLQVCSPDRDGNLFCLPTYDTGTPPKRMKDWLNEPIGGCRSGKYSSLNLEPLTVFGSVECRIFPCSTDPQELMSWVDILWNLKQFSKETEDVVEAIHLARTMPEAVVGRIFKNINIPLPKARHLIQFGCEQAYELAMPLVRKRR